MKLGTALRGSIQCGAMAGVILLIAAAAQSSQSLEGLWVVAGGSSDPVHCGDKNMYKVRVSGVFLR